MAECGGEIPEFQCTRWVGWAAAATPSGDRWIVPLDPDCPPGRDTATYLSMDAATRLACTGDDEWRLIAYIAAPGGRGCMPIWNVDPFWMDPSCSFFFPQPVEREVDSDTSLHGFIAPELCECGPGGCPWDDLTGSWVEVVGHLDDPVAETRAYVLNSQVDEGPSPPPDPDLAVFGCRLGFVVTESHGNDRTDTLRGIGALRRQSAAPAAVEPFDDCPGCPRPRCPPTSFGGSASTSTGTE